MLIVYPGHTLKSQFRDDFLRVAFFKYFTFGGLVSRAFSSFPYLQETLSDAYRYSDASLRRPQNTYIIINYLKRHRSATSTASRSRVQRNAPQRNASLEPHFDLPHAFRSLGLGQSVGP